MFHWFKRVEQKLDRIIWILSREVPALNAILEEIEDMTPELQKVVDAVAAERTVVDSAVVLIKSLSDQIKASANDPAALLALADSISAQAADLGAAVTANTPAAPPAPAPEPPVTT